MIAKNIFSIYPSPSINQMSPIHTQNHRTPIHFARNENLFKNKSHQKQIYSTRKDTLSQRQYTDQKNSLLLKSYQKYDQISQQQKPNIDHIRVRQIQSKLNSSQNSPIFQRSLKNEQSHQKQLSQNRFDHYNSRIPAQKSLPSQYELLLEYELKRQKQKNEILQKRIQNKQNFIVQMKTIQQELTISYARCQQELNKVNVAIYEMENRENALIREKNQQNQELRHQILRLQRELKQMPQFKHKFDVSKRQQNAIQSNFNSRGSSASNQQSQMPNKKSKSAIDLTKDIRNQAQAKKLPPNPKKSLNHETHYLKQSINENPRQMIRQSSEKKRNPQNNTYMIRSKTTVQLNQNGHHSFKHRNKVSNQQNTPLNSQFSSINPSHPSQAIKKTKLVHEGRIEQQVSENIERVSKFIFQFIQMCHRIESKLQEQRWGQEQAKMKNIQQKYCLSKKNNSNKQIKLTHQLSSNWKMLKQVIREWFAFKIYQECQGQRENDRNKDENSKINSKTKELFKHTTRNQQRKDEQFSKKPSLSEHISITMQPSYIEEQDQVDQENVQSNIHQKDSQKQIKKSKLYYQARRQ